MIKKNINISNKDFLSRIAQYLMLHGSFLSEIGLLNGKMGICLFFFLYGRQSGVKRYERFAGNLFDEVYKEIHKDSPVYFRNGLCGIGWAIEYLLRNHFVEGDPDEIFEELDKRIVQWDVRHITDYSLETGLAGIACYVIARRQNRISENSCFTKDYITELCIALQKGNQNTNTQKIILETYLNSILDNETIEEFYNPLDSIVRKIRFKTSELFEKPRPKGIEKGGYSGVGLKFLMNPKP
jgi:lantibiotic modifying enzyme